MKDNSKFILVAGATGDVGGRIVKRLLQRKAKVKALVRNSSDQELVRQLIQAGVEVVEIDYHNSAALVDACRNTSCVVSAGLREVIVNAQFNLLRAAIKAGVPRFIPSDYCIDYRALHPGDNRNLDLRREFSQILSDSPIRATSILNGMFTDLLLGQAPVILFKQKRIFFWGDADQKMDFTTIDNTAEYTAEVALDHDSPRWLLIAGESTSMRDIKTITTDLSGKEFKFLRPGGLSVFKAIIKITKTFASGRREVFPAWQGMQYLHDMLTGLPKFRHLDNDRYGSSIRWTKIKDVLQAGER
jgi:uncharacterized protein YbjT (DUF2867 family)